MTTTGVTEATAPHAARWRALFWLALTSLLGMSTWFSGTAVIGPLREAWALTPAQGSWLTIAVQLGFVTGALIAALTNLVDLVPPHRLLVSSLTLAATANSLFSLAHGPGAGMPLRFLTGVFLAGVYPTALKLMATWFRTDRGLALGIMVGSLTLGSAAPHLVRGLGGAFPWRQVVQVTSWLTAVAVVVGHLAVREGPYPFPRARFDPTQAGRVLRDRGVRLACIGYFGHMWELYAMWGWIAVFLGDVFGRRGIGGPQLASAWAFAVIGAGFLGSWWAGAYSDRVGRPESAALAMAVSGACALTIGLLAGNGPAWLLIAIALVWGASVVADSAQFSTMVTEMADPAYVGTALTLQLAIGFTLTAATLWLVPVLREHGGWLAAFAMLAPGPIVGIVAMLALRAPGKSLGSRGGRE